MLLPFPDSHDLRIGPVVRISRFQALRSGTVMARVRIPDSE